MSLDETYSATPPRAHLYSPEQLASLRALGVSYQELVLVHAPDAVASQEAPAADVLTSQKAPAADVLTSQKAPAADVLTSEEEKQCPTYVRLGSWLIQFQDELPVQGLPWIRDLELFLGGKLSRVSAPANTDDAIDLTEFALDELSPSQKRALWNKLTKS